MKQKPKPTESIKSFKGLELMAGGKYKVDVKRKHIVVHNKRGKVIDNIDENSLTDENINRMVEGLEHYIMWCKENGETPMKSEFAKDWLGVHRQRLSEWEKLSTVVADICKTIETGQEIYCVKEGFKMRNPAHAIFMLKCNHGYKETQVIEHSGEITVNITNYSKQPMIDAQYTEKKV